MDGIIVVNKPKGCTSHDIVYKVKKITNSKVGHTGTLDPMATGVLPLLIGKGTLCSKYLINHDKIYQAKIQLGQKTDTADEEGEVVEEQKVGDLSQENVKQILNTFIGKQEQVPPMYSAIKVNGKKLYEYARKGQTVEIQPRQIEIYDIKLMKLNKGNNQLQFQVSCSKGTYIRSLCEDIAKRLGTVGYMCELNRVQVGDFNISNSVTVEELQEDKEAADRHLISLERLFENKPSINLNSRKLQLFLNGVQLTVQETDGVYKVYSDNKFVGVGVVNKGLVKRDIVVWKKILLNYWNLLISIVKYRKIRNGDGNIWKS